MIKYVNEFLMDLLGALGIDVEILFAPTAKRLEQKARSNAQKFKFYQLQSFLKNMTVGLRALSYFCTKNLNEYGHRFTSIACQRELISRSQKYRSKNISF